MFQGVAAWCKLSVGSVDLVVEALDWGVLMLCLAIGWLAALKKYWMGWGGGANTSEVPLALGLILDWRIALATRILMPCSEWPLAHIIMIPWCTHTYFMLHYRITTCTCHMWCYATPLYKKEHTAGTFGGCAEKAHGGKFEGKTQLYFGISGFNQVSSKCTKPQRELCFIHEIEWPLRRVFCWGPKCVRFVFAVLSSTGSFWMKKQPIRSAFNFFCSRSFCV